MTRGQQARVVGVGMVTPLGTDAISTAAAVRAGISRMSETQRLDLRGKPLVMGLLENTLLTPLSNAFRGRSLSTREARMIRLGGSAVREALASTSNAVNVPLLLGVPEDIRDASFIQQLSWQSEVAFDFAHSQLLPFGRASGLIAAQRALEMLATGHHDFVLIGGVDSYFDALLLDGLDRDQRLRAVGTVDGFTPGEGAGFVLLRRPGSLALSPSLATLSVATRGSEPGHRHSREPHLGQGLSDAFRALFDAAGDDLPPIECVYAGYNGESLWAKEWGVAFVRNTERFASKFRFEHPADCFGDPGAALGALMLGLAAIGFQRNYRPDPCLVWCGSDREQRAAALLRAT